MLTKLALEGLPLSVDYVQIISTVSGYGTAVKIYFKNTVNATGYLEEQFAKIYKLCSQQHIGRRLQCDLRYHPEFAEH